MAREVIAQAHRGLITAVARARELAAAASAAARAHDTSRARAAARAGRLFRRGRWEPAEALRAGLLDPRVPTAEAERHASRHAAGELTRALNPSTLMVLTGENAMFCRVGAAIGVPMPGLYGVVGREGGWSAASGRPLPSQEDASRFLATELPDRFVLRPSAGRHGQGVRALQREGGELVDLGGRRRTPEGLVAELWGDPRWELFVVQERVLDHPDLDRILEGRGQPTLRVTTFVSEDGAPQVVHAGLVLRPAAGGADDDREDALGGALAEIEVATGRVGTLREPRPDGAGFQAANGPGVPPGGIVLPEWPAVLDVARESAVRLLPRRGLAWDIVIADRGPLVVEADGRWDPWPSPRFGDAVRAMRRALAAGGPAEVGPA